MLMDVDTRYDQGWRLKHGLRVVQKGKVTYLNNERILRKKPKETEGHVFASHADAEEYVLKRALAGSRYHQLVLVYIARCKMMGKNDDN